MKPKLTTFDQARVLRLRAVLLSKLSSPSGRFAAVFLLLAVIASLFFLPLLSGKTMLEVASRQNGEYPWAYIPHPAPPPIHYDQSDTFYPWQVFISRALRSGELPLWNPYSFFGEPFFANGTNGVLYPPRLLLSLFVPPARVHDLLLLSHMLAGGILMYFLLADIPLPFFASIFGAVVWMINSFMLSWMAREHFIVIEAFLPLAILLLRRAVLKSSLSAGVGAGVVLALIYLGGNLLFVGVAFALCGACAVYLLARKWWNSLRAGASLANARLVFRDLAVLAAAFLIAVGLSSVQLIPTLELSASIGREPEDVGRFSLQLITAAGSGLIYFFIEPPIYITSAIGAMPEPYHRLLFLGTPTALLALIGIWRKDPLATYARWLAIFTLLYTTRLGVNWIVYKIAPVIGHLKPLGRVFFAFDFAAVILASFGLAWLISKEGVLARLRFARNRIPVWQIGITSLLILIVVAQLYHFGLQVIPNQPYQTDYLFPETPEIHELTKEETRIMPIEPALIGSTPMIFGIESAGGYESMLPNRATRLWRMINSETLEAVVNTPLTNAVYAGDSGRIRFDILARAGAARVVAPPASVSSPGNNNLTASAAMLAKEYDGPDGRIFRVKGAMPAAYVVYECERAETSLYALQRFTDGAFDPARSVIIEDDYLSGSASSCGPADTRSAHAFDPARVIGRSLNRIEIQVTAAKAGWLVVNESYDRGWTATMDGSTARVLPANYAFRAIAVTAGEHIVEMRYRPQSFRTGMIVSLITLAMVISFGGFLASKLVGHNKR